MAEKILGTDGLEHIKEQFVKKPAGVSVEALNKTDYTYYPDAASQLYYKPHIQSLRPGLVRARPPARLQALNRLDS